MYKIAICLNTFLRDKLMEKSTQSILDNFPQDCILLIADQGYNCGEKNMYYDYLKSQIPCEIYYLSFDSGLSYARNFLVFIANSKNIPYSLIITDSTQFPSIQNFEQLFNKLNSNDLISFGLIPFKDPFIAKTNTLLNLWDEELKIYDYEFAQANYLKKGYKITINSDYNFKKIKTHQSKEYLEYCKRIKYYKQLSAQKLKCI